MRILIWLALFVLVILALKKKIQTVSSPEREQKPAPPAAGNGTRAGEAETMVCCAACQVYIPASEAVYKGRQTYCCEEHASQADAH
ncbi:PP0621 family protein [Undibacterium terreum]|uniref:Uncharacterized protein n=1 Tax=Undibacterium terreum TaxID=1224302 RepID=A0A916UPY2_9BURK|nr:PP0621 family protein [Undibacterium terreum]GGC82113.1 hypothetical protein GCM10011396_31770 [Undibacterium terreum]